MSKPLRPGKTWWVLLPMLGWALWLAVLGDNRPVHLAAQPVAQAPPQAPTGMQTAMQTAPAGGQLASRTPYLTPAAASASASVPILLVPRAVLMPVDRQPNRAPRDLFSARSWAAPASLSAPVAAPAPVAPPVPFTYIGKRLDGAAWQVFLSRADQTFIVSAGSTIDGNYRIDAVTPPTLSLTYLPLGQAQMISIGEAQ